MDKKLFSLFCVSYDHETKTWDVDNDILVGYLNGSMLDAYRNDDGFFYPRNDEEETMDNNALNILLNKLNN